MSGFFVRMAQRASGSEVRWQARPRARFEPSPAAPGAPAAAGAARAADAVEAADVAQGATTTGAAVDAVGDAQHGPGVRGEPGAGTSRAGTSRASTAPATGAGARRGSPGTVGRPTPRSRRARRDADETAGRAQDVSEQGPRRPARGEGQDALARDGEAVRASAHARPGAAPGPVATSTTPVGAPAPGTTAVGQVAAHRPAGAPPGNPAAQTSPGPLDAAVLRGAGRHASPDAPRRGTAPEAAGSDASALADGEPAPHPAGPDRTGRDADAPGVAPVDAPPDASLDAATGSAPLDTAVLDTAVLVRGHVVPALRARGVDLGDDVDVRLADDPGAPARSGGASVRIGTARQNGEHRGGAPTSSSSRRPAPTGPPQVHVHIDRIDVVQPVAPPAPQPNPPVAPPRDPAVENRLGDFLELRRADRR